MAGILNPRDQARAILEAVNRNPGLAGEPDLLARIEAALAEAFKAGRDHGLEEAANQCKGVIVCEQCFKGMASILPRIAERIRSLARLRGEP